MLNADAKVTVVSPREGLNDEVAYRIEKGQVDYMDRKFEPADLDGVDMVLTAIDDPEASTQIWKLCKEKKLAANIADVPPECDFYFGSVHRDGPLQIMVSTNGNGPKLASIVRKQIAANLPDNIGAAIQKVGALRRKLRRVAPDAEEGPRRMQWFVPSTFSLSESVKVLSLPGCQRSASHGLLRTSSRWMRMIWKRSLASSNQGRSRPLIEYVSAMRLKNLPSMGALVGGD